MTGKSVANALRSNWLARNLPPHVRSRALIIAALLTFLLLALMLVARPALNALDHWTADLRTAFFTYRLDTQHPDIALVLIDEEAITEAQKDSPTRYRSPIDRGLLARLVDRLDATGAKAIGLDIIVDQASEAAKDKLFFAAVQRAKSHIVLARLDFADGKAAAPDEMRDYHHRFLEATGRANGYVTSKAQLDGVVRTQPTPGTSGRATFPEELAKAGGWKPPTRRVALSRPSDKIAWLRAPRDNSTTFLTLPATLLISPPDTLSQIERAIVDKVRGRLAIVGVRFQDRTDRHYTPLTKRAGDLMPGMEIHAHVVAQLIDQRSYDELSLPVQLGFCFLTAFAAVVVAWSLPHSSWLIGSIPLAVFVLVSALLFWETKLILPFTAPALMWVAGVYAGRLQSWRDPITTI